MTFSTQALHTPLFPSIGPAAKFLSQHRRRLAFPSRCNAKENPVDEFWSSVRKEMLSHVDIEPKYSDSADYESPQVEQIKRSEKFALNYWNSTEFHVTGVAIAVVLAFLMILNSPMNM